MSLRLLSKCLRISVVGLTSAALFLTACAPVVYPATTWQVVNDTRIAAGLQPLQWDDSLLPIVSMRAKTLADNLALSHDGLDDAYHDSAEEYMCELVGRQPLWERPSAIGIGFEESLSHRRCVDNPIYTKGAIAAYVGSDGWVYEVIWLTN